MKFYHRIAAAFFCVCLLFRLTYAAAPEVLYFVAAENMVLPLSADTMPFWHDGYLYISGDIFTGTVRDALGISRAKIGDGILLYRGHESLLFRQNYPYAQDTDETTYAPGMVWYEDNAYVPASVVARYFDLLYSVVDVERGKLVWLRNSSFKMNASAFAKAATFQLNSVYHDYLKTLEPEPEPEYEPDPPEIEYEPDFPTDNFHESVTPEPSDFPLTAPDEPPVTPSAPATQTPVTPSAPTTQAPVTPSAPATQAPVTPSAPTTQKPVTPSAPTTQRPVTPSAPTTTQRPVTPSTPTTQTPVTPSAPATTQPPVTPPANETIPSATDTPPDPSETLSGGQTVYLCLRGDDSTAALLDALDRHSLRAAVFCDETFLTEQGDLLRRMAATGHSIGLYVSAAPDALERLEACNRQLQRTIMEKTRLVLLDGADEDLRRAARDAGFLCLQPTLDRSEFPLRTSRQARELLELVSERSGDVFVWFGGIVNRSGLNAFVSDALELGDACPPLTESAFF